MAIEGSLPDHSRTASYRTRPAQQISANAGQEFVIAGYTPNAKNFDAMILAYYEGKKLIYAARTR
jgi:hypothetical protein